MLPQKYEGLAVMQSNINCKPLPQNMVGFRLVVNQASRIVQLQSKNASQVKIAQISVPKVSFINNDRLFSTSVILYKNPKFKKDKMDNDKSRVMSNLRKRILQDIRDGGRDPASNWRLEKTIKVCKEAGMSRTTLDRALNRKSEEGESIIGLETPDGVHILVVCGSNRMSKCKGNLNKACQKFPWKVSKESTIDNFEKQCVVRAELKDGSISEDEAMDIAIEVGADDVESESNKELKFLCSEKEFGSVEKTLKDQTNFTVTMSAVEYRPYGRLPVNKEVMELWKQFELALEKVDADGVNGIPILTTFHNLEEHS